MSHQVKPNFFIVGAPKCGTTAMFSYLSRHPEIFVSQRKEFNYFCDDLTFRNASGLFRYTGVDDYLAHFSGWNGQKRIGEASVWYLYSSRAAENIRNLCPDALIIAMIRNPVDMIYSLHSQLLINGDENIDDFESALAAEADRTQNRRNPRTDQMSCPLQGLWYTEVGMYSHQIRRYHDIFGKERVKVIVYDEFRADTPRIYSDVLEFLGVHDISLQHFDIVNARREVRNPQLWRFLKFGPPGLRRVWRAALPARVRGAALRWINQKNAVVRPPPPMKSVTRTYLQDLFRPEVERLSALLDRDLMPWVDTADGQLLETTEERHRA